VNPARHASLDLSPERERDLVVAAEAGDRRACTALVEAFTPAIAGIARRYRGSVTVSHEELMQEGVVGLLRAVRRYDPHFGTPFWAYAAWWVRQAMQQLVAEVGRPVVLSDRAARMLARVHDERQRHMRDHRKEPSIAQLAAATELAREQIESLLAVDRVPRGLDEPLGHDDGAGTLAERVADDGAAEAFDAVLGRILPKGVKDLAHVLDERERTVLFAHYGLGRPVMTLREIADDLGRSAERVRQIEAEALRKLRVAATGLPFETPVD